MTDGISLFLLNILKKKSGLMEKVRNQEAWVLSLTTVSWLYESRQIDQTTYAKL